MNNICMVDGYVPDHMRERRQFTGIIELLFKEVNEHRVAEGAG